MKRENKKIIVRDTDRELLKVVDDNQGRGKIFVYMSPNETDLFNIFHVGVSWNSLEKLAERAFCDIVFWEVSDASLTIRGKKTQWSLHFFNHKNNSRCEILLSKEETFSLKNILFGKTAKVR